MSVRWWRWSVGGALAVGGLIAAVVVTGLVGGWPRPGAAAAASERTIYVAAVEPKGGAGVADEAFPGAALPAGGGYILKAPDAAGRWEVSTYRWDPATMVVHEGDTVTLEIVGINGKEHPFRVEGHAAGGVVTRGTLTRVTFVAERAGAYKLICDLHKPTMQADLIVLAR